jgi:hypothetical protein
VYVFDVGEALSILIDDEVIALPNDATLTIQECCTNGLRLTVNPQLRLVGLKVLRKDVKS